MTDKFQLEMNVFILACNLLETTLLGMGKNLRQEYRQKANLAVKSLRIFNKLAEKVLSEKDIEIFDEDVNYLRKIMQYDIIASSAGVEVEFLDHIKKFFTDKNLIENES